MNKTGYEEIDERLFENYLEMNKSSPSLSSASTFSSSDSDKESPRKKSEDTEKKQKSLYKTELCRNWEETNHCRYGAKCQYAHGAADLREIERHPKYKTQKCRTFHQTGSCPYGSRCTFRHFNLPGDDIVVVEEKETKSFDIFANLKPNNTQWPAFDNDDSLLPTNAESLLPHQLLFDLESPDQEPARRCPLRNYVHLPSLQPQYQQEKSFFHPWLF